jgi:hypothetical protein
MAEAGDTDPASLALRLNLTIPPATPERVWRAIRSVRQG